MNDNVNRPAHYTAFPVEPIEVLEHLNHNRGAACKYLIRAGLKDPAKEIEDLEKASWYVSREIARVKAQREKRAALSGIVLGPDGSITVNGKKI